MLRGLEENNHLPDYEVFLEGDNVLFTNRNTLLKKREAADKDPLVLQEKTLEAAKKIAPGYDIYALKQEWLSHWVASGKPELKSVDAAFVGFCKFRATNKPIF